jgi:hypothetical protein
MGCEPGVPGHLRLPALPVSSIDVPTREGALRTRSMNEPKKMLAATGQFMVTGQAVLSVHGPLPADHPIYATVGLITAESAQLEHILDLIIWELAGVTQPIGSCITGQMMGHAPRFNVIQALGRLRGLDAQLLKSIQSLSNQLFEVAGERNRIVHDAWYIEHTSGQIGQFKSISHKKNDFGFVDIDVAAINATLSKMQDKLAKVQELRADIITAIHT